MKYESHITYHSTDMANVQFLKNCQSSRSRSGRKILVPIESSYYKEYTYEI
jgi:hypothetical protein